jgi:hypothetical protein
MADAQPPFPRIEPLLLAAPALRDIGPWPFTWIGDLLRVIFACRVACGSVILALAVFAGVPQSRDLFLEFSGHAVTMGDGVTSHTGSFFHGFFPWLAYFLVHVLTWAIVVHSSARRVLRSPAWLVGPKREITPRDLRIYDTRFRLIVTIMPAVLSFGTFVAVAIGYSLAMRDLPDAGQQALNSSAEFLRNSTPGFWAALALAAVTYPAWLRAMERNAIGNGTANPATAENRLPDNGERYSSPFGRAADNLARWWLYGIFILLLAVIVFAEVLLRYFGGMYLVPLLFGAWVPVLTKLGDLSMRTRIPFILGAFALLAVLSVLFGEMHDVGRATGPPGERGTIVTAIERWKAANCASGVCPSPIIVTTAGGASRAAFFTGTVIGELLDRPCLDDGPDCTSILGNRPVFARRLFAISGVSGGSLGAVQIAAAIADARNGQAPCTTPAAHWFVGGKPKSWRNCLQILASADFLSATTVALAFRDPFHFINRLVGSNPAAPLMPDRAAVLERQWIRSYGDWTRAGDSDIKSSAGLGLGFTQLGPFNLPQGDWQPGLVLNGTSEDTGRRIVTSHFLPRGVPDLPNDFLHVDAYDAHELISQPDRSRPAGSTACVRDKALHGCDFTLASAAGNSARFPIISPSGQLKSREQLVDRIVDGGYFENDGATTTFELVIALKDARLSPRVIHIANDPLAYKGAKLAETLSPVPAATPDQSRYLSAINGPIGAMFAVRVAHGSFALEQLRRELPGGMVEFFVYGEPENGAVFEESGQRAFRRERENGQTCFQFRVSDGDARLKNISMSWWLSKPVQEYLDRQTYFAPNCAAFLRVREWLSQN